MTSHRLRWARISVTALLVLLTALRAEAVEKVLVGPGTTLDGLARKYGVPKAEIARANRIQPEALLRDGQVLVIPDPPPLVRKARTLSIPAAIRGNRIAVRRGPGTEYYRITLLDHGAKLRVTAVSGEWYQVSGQGIPNGWIRGDFLTLHKAASTQATAKTARSTPESPPPAKERAIAKDAAHRTAASNVHLITGDNVSLRAGPGRDTKRLTLMDRGTRVQVLAREGEWIKVSTSSGRTGWVLGDFVATQTAKVAAKSSSRSEPGPRVIVGDRVSIRAEASRQSERVAMLDDGARLTLLGRKGDWCRVRLPGGRTGWVVAQYVGMKSRSGVRAAQVVQTASADAKKVKRDARRDGHRRYAASGSARTSVGQPGASGGASGDVVRTAFAYRGARYRYGGSSRGGFDCSGFTRYVYSRKGISLPHRSADQFRCGLPVSKNELKPGDLVFFQTTRRGISHVGIYVGNGTFIHASSARGRVRVDRMDTGYYAQRYRGARRVR